MTGPASGDALGAGSSNPLGAAFDWLAHAQDQASQAHLEWVSGVALLPLGRRFSAVCLSARLVHAGVGATDRDTVNATLAELLHGPVIHNSLLHTYHALITPYPPARWAYGEIAPMLSSGQFLSVPAADLTGPTGLRWAVRPHSAGVLCSVPAVAALVALSLRPGGSR
ncbi:hypothetical protein [Streptomyces sp. Je 1-369]|uniref:hypothetical protein n=1 Tax=Streptomyces sp. Je 1-369 TaxID=2966192 RepID=UPI00228607C4|nr:hypothetical protein [Streptomyces sp. Je 1-369]WAL94013.1 hypothetical protein NOO62_05540 [Streptomyces sp. Je 1-369]